MLERQTYHSLEQIRSALSCYQSGNPLATHLLPYDLQLVLNCLMGHLNHQLQYELVDEESQEQWLTDEQHEKLSSWERRKLAEWYDLPASMGYGDVVLLTKGDHVGLMFSLGGSPMNSAITSYVLPSSWEFA